MTSPRRLASLPFGALLAVAVLKGAACSAIDPNPPDPHISQPDDPLKISWPDASDAASRVEAGS